VPPLRRVLESSAVCKVRHEDGSKSVNGFRVREELGSGSFAKVKLCEEESSTERFAMKVFRKGRLRRQRDFIGGSDGSGMKIRTSLDKVHNEVNVMKRIAHPNCIRLFAIFDEADKDGKMYLVIEYAAKGCTMEWDGDRCTYYAPVTNALIPEHQAQTYVFDTLSGLGYLHSSMVAHRDIKPQNLLVNGDGVVKIGDFGVAIEMGEDMLVHGTEGTYYFYAPEMCRPNYAGHDGRRADVWAVGVTLWAFLFGSVPFFHLDLVRLLESIAEAQYELPSSPSVSSAGSALLRCILCGEAADRPLCPELLQDAWCRTVAATRGSPGRATAQMC